MKFLCTAVVLALSAASKVSASGFFELVSNQDSINSDGSSNEKESEQSQIASSGSSNPSNSFYHIMPPWELSPGPEHVSSPPTFSFNIPSSSWTSSTSFYTTVPSSSSSRNEDSQEGVMSKDAFQKLMEKSSHFPFIPSSSMTSTTSTLSPKPAALRENDSAAKSLKSNENEGGVQSGSIAYSMSSSSSSLSTSSSQKYSVEVAYKSICDAIEKNDVTAIRSLLSTTSLSLMEAAFLRNIHLGNDAVVEIFMSFKNRFSEEKVKEYAGRLLRNCNCNSPNDVEALTNIAFS